jgi:hypothetical protein
MVLTAEDAGVRAAAISVVAAGVALAVFLALRAGLDPLGATLLALIVALGALVVAIARRLSGGSVRPLDCPRCGGVISSHAPYCKHCGERLA